MLLLGEENLAEEPSTISHWFNSKLWAAASVCFSSKAQNKFQISFPISINTCMKRTKIDDTFYIDVCTYKFTARLKLHKSIIDILTRRIKSWPSIEYQVDFIINRWCSTVECTVGLLQWLSCNDKWECKWHTCYIHPKKIYWIGNQLKSRQILCKCHSVVIQVRCHHFLQNKIIILSYLLRFIILSL